MFLTEAGLFQSFWNTLNSIFSWLENHSGIIGIIVSLIIGSNLFWLYIYIKKKRAKASGGFYNQLLFQINNLQSLLDDNGLLETKNSDNGNIYSLIYNDSTLNEVCGGLHKPSEELLNDIKKLTHQLKNILIESKNNVYPKASKKTKWYNSQKILFNFCEFMEQESMKGITNIAKINDNFKHIVKCQELVDAMNYIKESI